MVEEPVYNTPAAHKGNDFDTLESATQFCFHVRFNNVLPPTPADFLEFPSTQTIIDPNCLHGLKGRLNTSLRRGNGDLHFISIAMSMYKLLFYSCFGSFSLVVNKFLGYFVNLL